MGIYQLPEARTVDEVNIYSYMMTSSNGDIFCITGPLCGNSPVTGECPSQRVSKAEILCFFVAGMNELSKNNQLADDKWCHWTDI